jgi:hypothetical protein
MALLASPVDIKGMIFSAQVVMGMVVSESHADEMLALFRKVLRRD